MQLISRLSLFLLALSQVAAQSSPTNWPSEPVTTISCDLKGDLSTEQVHLSVLTASGRTILLSGTGVVNGVTTLGSNWTTFTIAVPTNEVFSRLNIDFRNPGKQTIGSGTSAKRQARKVTLSTSSVLVNSKKLSQVNRLLTGPVWDEKKASTAGSQILSGELADGGQYWINAPRRLVNSAVCDDVSNTNKVCFTLRGLVGDEIYGEGERIDIEAVLADGSLIQTHTNVELTSQYERFAVQGNGASRIARVNIRFNNAGSFTLTGTPRVRAVQMDWKTVNINGATFNNTNTLLGGKLFETDQSNGCIITDLRNGQLNQNGELAIVLQNFAPDSSDCDNASVSNKLCFRLKRDVDNKNWTMAERVNIGYFDGQNNVVVHRDFQLSSEFQRFLVKFPVGTTARYGFIQLTGQNGALPAVTLDQSSVFINGQRIEEPFRLLGGPVYEARRRGIKDHSLNETTVNENANGKELEGIMYAGKYFFNGEYRLNMPKQLLTNAACGDRSVTSIFCFKLRGAVGLRIPGEGERVRIQYQTYDGVRQTVISDYSLSDQWEQFAVTPLAGHEIQRVIIDFINDRCCFIFNKITYDRNVHFKTDELRVDGDFLSNSSAIAKVIAGPQVDIWRKQNNEHGMVRLNALLSGTFAWQNEYFIERPVFEADCSSPDQTGLVCFDLKGQFGQSRVSESERVDISYQDSRGIIVHVHRNVPLTVAFSRFGIRAPTNRVVSRVIIRFLNDRHWSEDGQMLDRNVFLNIDTVSNNGVVFKDTQRRLSSPLLSDTNAQAITRGVFAWQGEYYLNVSPLDPYPDYCNDPKEDKSKLICIPLRGDQGEHNAKETELIRVTYFLSDGSSVIAYNYYAMTKNFTVLSIKPLTNLTVTKLRIHFLNDKVSVVGGMEIDRNIHLDTNALFVYGKQLTNIYARLGGNVYKRWLDAKDWNRVGLVVRGIFAWNGYYDIDLSEVFNTVNACTPTVNDNSTIKSVKAICFSMKAAIGVNQVNSDGEMISISYVTADNKTVSVFDTYPISNTSRPIFVPIPSNVTPKALKVVHLNPSETENSQVILDLTSFVINGQSFEDTTPFTNEIPVVGIMTISIP